jgi:hypothetical protein
LTSFVVGAIELNIESIFSEVYLSPFLKSIDPVIGADMQIKIKKSEVKITHEIWLAVAIIIVVVASAGCASNKNENSDSQNAFRLNANELHPIGIIDPDGNKSIWVISSKIRKDLQDMLQKYHVEEVAGLEFYKLTSWKDTYQILLAATEQQSRILYNMANELKQIKQRGVRLPLTGYTSTTSLSGLEKRVQELEKSMDGGYP